MTKLLSIMTHGRGHLTLAALLALSCSLAQADDKPAQPPSSGKPAASDKPTATDKPATADKPAALDAAARFELMCQQYQLVYQKTSAPGQPANYQLAIKDSDGQTSVIVVKVLDSGWRYSDGKTLEIIYAYTQVDKHGNVPDAVALKINAFNESLYLGAACCDEYGVFMQLAFYMDPDMTLEPAYLYMYSLHHNALHLKEAIQPAIAAAAGEKK